MSYYDEDLAVMDFGSEKEYNRLIKHNKEMLDSMSYASIIQKGILPQERHLKRLFKESFIMYKPQHIIGGDMYWICQKGNYKVFAVGDCTGHGVSGAMLSVLAISFLNYLILGKNVTGLGEVLEEMDKKWIETFHNGIDMDFNNDWMEIGLCAFNTETREFFYAGAFNKLIYITDGETKTIMGNRYPIGGWQLEKNRPFTEHSFVLPQNTMVYLFSDGYKDQFSEQTKKRFGSYRFMELIKNIAHLSVENQAAELEDQLSLWMGNEIQTDDICVMGIRL